MGRPLKPEMVRYLNLLDELCAEGRRLDSPTYPINTGNVLASCQ
ncbi:MAG: hypothetical protein AAF827_05420 [Cyanobacteria bacterium P01_D01_bin.6]